LDLCRKIAYAQVEDIGTGLAMKRREFITLLGGAAAALPLTARAQPAVRRPTLGLLIPGSPATYGQRVAALVQQLEKLGWADGRTIAIEYRWAATQRFDEVLAEFVRSKVDVIFTSGTPPTVVAKRATSEIPIVFAPAGDPLASGLVASLSRPGGNVTGLSNQTADIASKRVELLREVAGQVRRLAIIVKSYNASAASEMRAVEVAAGKLGIEVVPLEIGEAGDIEPAIGTLKGRADAVYIVIDSLVTTHANRLNTLALDARLPTMHGARELVAAGGLMSYAANYDDLFRRGAEYIDKILRGTKPADIPVEQPTKFDLVINLTTAKALGLTIPQLLIATADELIE
jgi:putative tryptophan/tyrosine transport system substrate-binding protein